MDQRTDRPTNTARCRVACTRLKSSSFSWLEELVLVVRAFARALTDFAHSDTRVNTSAQEHLFKAQFEIRRAYCKKYVHTL